MARAPASPQPQRRLSWWHRLGGRRWLRCMADRSLAITLLLCLIGVPWFLWQQGFFSRTAAIVQHDVFQRTARAGLAVQQVIGYGRGQTEADELVATAGVSIGQSMLAVDAGAIKERLEHLRWIERASVRRLWPDTVEIRVIERRPLAVWQHQGERQVIDTSGAPIEGEPWRTHIDLPVIVGAHAPEHTLDLFRTLSNEPDLFAKVEAASWISNRRWVLHLQNGMAVHLPERHSDGAWRTFAREARETDLLERAITVVDLRESGRLVLRLDPKVVELVVGERGI